MVVWKREGLYNKMHNGTVPDACSTFFCGPNKTACCEFSEQVKE